ncbi:hypothetical protein L208DRAFT_1484946 [Tricholoma matsutake]|nr:hypothetical protein L208DRAFT_1484946 [Tricholoma matsutake 945]
MDASDSISCGICSQVLDNITILEREKHYEHHFCHEKQSIISHNLHSIPHIPAKSSSHKSFELFGKVKPKWMVGKENDFFWYSSLDTLPPSNYTPGIIPLLRKYLRSCHAEGITRRAALCYKSSVHVNRELWDASWGCGYRNFLIACAALMDQSFQPLYFPLLDAPLGPGVRNLQTWIELAWQAGFDREGAQELKNLVGTTKWIGTSDIWVAFTSRGIPAELVDFNLKGQPGVQILIDWVVEYFSHSKGATIYDTLRDASPVIDTDRMPLILQDHRHSRTIVGYEVSRNGTVNLLVFDPAFIPDSSLRNLALSSATFSPHNFSSMTTDQSTHANQSSNSTHKRPSSALAFSTEDGNGQNDSAEPSLQGKKTTGDDNGGNPGRTKFVPTLSRQQFARFRMSPKRLRKQKYQILYFPMSAPLTEQERTRNKVVTSRKIC